MFPRLLRSPGPQLGLSKVSGLSKECVCSVKMHQIHVLKTSEGWLMSAKGCGCSTLSVSSGFKSQSGLLARSQLWVAAGTGRLSAKLSFLRWCRRCGRQGPRPPPGEHQARLCVELAVDVLPLPRPQAQSLAPPAQTVCLGGGRRSEEGGPGKRQGLRLGADLQLLWIPRGVHVSKSRIAGPGLGSPASVSSAPASQGSTLPIGRSSPYEKILGAAATPK